MKSRGQVLVTLLIFLPLFLLIFGMISRVGGLTLAHDQIENHCDKKVLDALAEEAKALEQLGDLNPKSRLIIGIRRVVDSLIETGVANIYMPYLTTLDRSLRGVQKIISISQKTIKVKGVLATACVLHSPTPKKFIGKIQESYDPLIPTYHLKEEEGYEGETGAPLEPTNNFEKKQTIEGKIKIYSEKFLWDWADFTKADFQGHLQSKDMTLKCKARISMKKLEDPWLVQLIPPVPAKL